MPEELDLSRLDHDRLQRLAASFRASRDFASVLRDYTFALVGFRTDPRFVNKLISHQSRFRLVNHLLFLHAEKVLGGKKGGVTYTEMADLCAQYPDIGLRVLKTMLPMLVLTGYAHVGRDENDGRMKIYTPTAKLFAVARVRLETIIAALQVLQPDVPYAAALRDDPLFLLRAVSLSGRASLDAEPLAVLMPEFATFAGEREGAAPVIYAVMLADLDAAPLPSRAAIANRFGLSKTQVWSVLSEGARLGYFVVDGNAPPAATGKLRECYTALISLELAFCAAILTVRKIVPLAG
jgi:hypothetical protein